MDSSSGAVNQSETTASTSASVDRGQTPSPPPPQVTPRRHPALSALTSDNTADANRKADADDTDMCSVQLPLNESMKFFGFVPADAQDPFVSEPAETTGSTKKREIATKKSEKPKPKPKPKGKGKGKPKPKKQTEPQTVTFFSKDDFQTKTQKEDSMYSKAVCCDFYSVPESI